MFYTASPYDRPVSVALAVALMLVFVMGMAVQRGNTCTVVAFDDLLHRRDRALDVVEGELVVHGPMSVYRFASRSRAT